MRIRAAIVVAIFAFTFSRAAAQSPRQQDDTQSWNDLQITASVGKYFEVYTVFTARIGSNITRFSDGRVAAGIGWKPVKDLTILPFYTFIRARGSAGRFANEHRYSLRATYRFPIKALGLSHRSTYEYRDRATNSWRYRAAITVEKNLPKTWIPSAKAFVADEVFYDSALERWSRNRFTVGLNKTLTNKLSLDVYYMRQNDGFSRPGDLHVIGTNWRLRL